MELHCVEIDQRLKGKLWVCNVEFSVDLLLDLLPMVLFEGVITEGNDNGHGTFEGVNLLFESSLDGIVVQVLLKSYTNLGIVVSLLCNFFGLDVIELSLDPDFLELLPLLEGAPHNTTEL